jgi:hypothetical protein
MKLDGCVLSPCKNGGSCLDGPSKYTCKCVPGTTGSNCEIDINECESNPCKNRGVCSMPKLDMYKCTCLSEYIGINCENPVNSCTTFPCLNNGVCVQTPTTFKCVCPLGFTDNRCQTGVEAPKLTTQNFTHININIYGLMKFVEFDSYKPCIASAWNFVNPQIPTSSIVLGFTQAKSALEFTSSLVA